MPRKCQKSEGLMMAGLSGWTKCMEGLAGDGEGRVGIDGRERETEK